MSKQQITITKSQIRCNVCGGVINLSTNRSDYKKVASLFQSNHRTCSPDRLKTWNKRIAQVPGWTTTPQISPESLEGSREKAALAR